MDFTKDFLRAKGPCAAGFRWYLRHYEHASDYQQVLDALVEAGRIDDACWLLDQLGPTDTVLDVDLLAAEAVVFAGTIRVRRGIDVSGILRAGRSILCEGSVLAEGAILAGVDIHAAGAVKTAGRLAVGGGLRARWVLVQGPLQAGSNIQAEGVLRCGPLRVAGDIAVRGDLAVEGDVRGARHLRVSGDLSCAGPMKVELGIECGGSIRCSAHLDAGLGIRAGGSIVAAGAIRSGESIRAGGELRAGSGYGVYAGTGVPVEEWETSGVVCARERPHQLVSGMWSGADAFLAQGQEE